MADMTADPKHPLVLSTLPKTWILDLDGTIVKHNGYKMDGVDTLLPGVPLLLHSMPLSPPIHSRFPSRSAQVH